MPLTVPDRAAASISFDDVRFSYPTAQEVSLASLEDVAVLDQAPSQEVLKGVSFTAQAGQMVALVGPSGAGKTTISQLVPRIYDVRSGTVRVAGQDVRTVTQQSLRDAIGVVSQDAHLFHDSIEANLRYARPEASEAELWQALTAANIADKIAELPDGLATVVGDRGYRLSGGEKQRIAIARLLLKAPPIMILDEATAHLDSESERLVQHALSVALAGRTSLVIAHRLSTIRAADQVLVVDDGRIVQAGSHERAAARRRAVRRAVPHPVRPGARRPAGCRGDGRADHRLALSSGAASSSRSPVLKRAARRRVCRLAT